MVATRSTGTCKWDYLASVGSDSAEQSGIMLTVQARSKTTSTIAISPTSIFSGYIDIKRANESNFKGCEVT